MASKRVSLKGKGADLFFGGEAIAAEPVTVPEPSPPLQEDAAPEDAAAVTAPIADPAPSDQLAAPTPKQAIKRASKLASLQEIEPAVSSEAMARIRRTVKTPGREVSYVRLSPEEKARLGEVIYAFKRKGVKITETEISRIAVNCLLADHEQHGEQSVLARVLASLRD